MAMKADIKRVAKRLIPASIWNIWRRSHGRQNRHCIRHDKVPEHLFRNHRVLPRDKAFVLENSIRTHYHKGWRAEERYAPSEQDLEDHLYNRIRDDRQRIVPWLDHGALLTGEALAA